MRSLVADDRERLLVEFSYFGYLVDVVADSLAVAVFTRAAIVPAVFRCTTLCEPLAAFVAKQLAIGARVTVKFQFEFRVERAFAVPTDVGHDRTFSLIP